jgi:PST family polysaccharide transporter
MAVAAIMFCCSSEIILFMYGEQWNVSGPILHALSLGVYAQMMGNPTGAFFQSLGRTDLMFRCGVVNSVVMAIAIVAGLATGSVDVVSWLVSLAFFAQLASITYFLVHRGFQRSPSCLASFLPEVAGGVVAMAAGMAAGHLLPADMPVQLLGKAAVTAVALLAVYVATGQTKHLRSLLGR